MIKTYSRDTDEYLNDFNDNLPQRIRCQKCEEMYSLDKKLFKAQMAEGSFKPLCPECQVKYKRYLQSITAQLAMKEKGYYYAPKMVYEKQIKEEEV